MWKTWLSLILIFAAAQAWCVPTTVWWQAPESNVDGSPLTDLAGFRIYMRGGVMLIAVGADARTATINIPDGGETFLYATAVDAGGDESLPSNEVCRSGIDGSNCSGWIPPPIIMPGNASVILDWNYQAREPMTAFNLDDASYASKSFATGSYESGAYGASWGDSGNKMYITGTSNDQVDQFAASSPYDVDTLSYTQTFVNGSGERNPKAIHWSPDGLTYFGVTSFQDKVIKHTCSSAWDISTASYVQNFSVNAQDTTPQNLAFKSDGTKMYVVGAARDGIYSYDL